MRDTGIVRRVDELGRVVIPKEIRKTLRIKEGDPIEIFTDKEQLVFKKYSPISKVMYMAKGVAENLASLTEKSVVVCDNDCILFIVGGKKELVNKNISNELISILNDRKSIMLCKKDGDKTIPFAVGENMSVDNQIIVPIIGCGDCFGGVILFSNGNENAFTSSDVKLVQLSASILSMDC